MSALLRLVTDDDIPPAPLPARGQVPFAFATHVAPPQEHTRRCVYRTAGERRRLRARAARSRRHRKGQRGIVFGAARKGRTWSRARSYQDLRLRPEERAELTTGKRHLEIHYANRPRVLGDCETQGYLVRGAGPVKPCPWASCRHTLILEVKPKAGTMLRPSIKVNFPGRPFDELEETCSFRRPLRGDEMSLEAVGTLINTSMERARQIQEIALAKGRECKEAEDG